MSSKAKILLYTLVVIIVFTAIFYIIRPNTTFNKRQTAFSIKDTASISKVLIIKAQDTLTLERHKTYWKVNKKYKADDLYVKALLKALYLIEVKSPVPQEAMEIIDKKLQNGKKIIVFKGKKIIKKISLDGQTSDKSGNYAKLNDFQPFIIYIPSIKIDLNQVFNQNLDFWRTKNIFMFEPNEIGAISVIYPKNLEQSFYLIRKNDNYILQDYQKKELKNVNKEKILRYLTRFKNINFQKTADKKIFDSLKNQTPEFIIEIEDNQSNATKLEGYILIKNGQKDTDYFWGIINEKEAVLCKYYYFDLLLKSKDYFLIDNKTSK